MPEKSISENKLYLLSYKELMNGPYHFGRTMTYKLLRNPEAPVITIGKRKYMDGTRFHEWLIHQGENK